MIKLLLMPTVIAGVTAVSRKWGNTIGGILAGLPWVAAPILFFIAIERGVPFATNTIPGIMVGVLGWLFFCFIYVLVGQRFNAFISLMSGYIAYLVLGVFLRPFTSLISLHIWVLLVVIAIIITIRFFPKAKPSLLQNFRKLRFEIPLRMLMITLFVIAVTYFADILGPTWSGILTPFPIMSAVLGVFTHYTQGIEQVKTVYMGLFTGILGFSTFLYLQAYLMPNTTLLNAFLIGIAVDIVLTILSKKVLTNLKVLQ